MDKPQRFIFDFCLILNLQGCKDLYERKEGYKKYSKTKKHLKNIKINRHFKCQKV